MKETFKKNISILHILLGHKDWWNLNIATTLMNIEENVPSEISQKNKEKFLFHQYVEFKE